MRLREFARGEFEGPLCVDDDISLVASIMGGGGGSSGDNGSSQYGRVMVQAKYNSSGCCQK